MINDFFNTFVRAGLAYLSDFPYEADLLKIAVEAFSITGAIVVFFFPFALVFGIVRRLN